MLGKERQNICIISFKNINQEFLLNIELETEENQSVK